MATNEKSLELLKSKDFEDRVRGYEKASLKKERYEHCERVAQTSRRMAQLFGVDADLAYICGLSHDMCKSLDDAAMLSLASTDTYEISEAEKQKPSLLHGRAAAVVLKNSFGVEDSDFLEAIAFHTYGKKGLSALGKIVFAADKIEPGRENISEEFYEETLKKTLDEICIQIVSENIEYLNSKNRMVSPETLLFLESLKNSGGEN